ncbi:hypothetical protein THAOC_15004, partial [Thalassiosira oceanica]
MKSQNQPTASALPSRSRTHPPLVSVLSANGWARVEGAHAAYRRPLYLEHERTRSPSAADRADRPRHGSRPDFGAQADDAGIVQRGQTRSSQKLPARRRGRRALVEVARPSWPNRAEGPGAPRGAAPHVVWRAPRTAGLQLDDFGQSTSSRWVFTARPSQFGETTCPPFSIMVRLPSVGVAIDGRAVIAVASLFLSYCNADLSRAEQRGTILEATPKDDRRGQVAKREAVDELDETSGRNRAAGTSHGRTGLRRSMRTRPARRRRRRRRHLQETPAEKYYELAWSDLPPEVQSAYETLLTTEAIWCGVSDENPIGEYNWDDLDDEMRAQAEFLGYTEKIWCEDAETGEWMCTVVSPVQWESMAWSDLPSEVQSAYETLLTTEEMWCGETDEYPISDYNWDDLDDEMRAQAEFLGYTEKIWCEDLVTGEWTCTVDTPAPSAKPSPSPTREPVSESPVSESPVSESPVSSAPVSLAPVSSAPVSLAPVSESPVSSAPVSLAPVSSAPFVSSDAPSDASAPP